LSAAIFGRFLRFRRRSEAFFIERWRSCLVLRRFDDDCRLPPFRFECLAKIEWLRI
jgi:hypothetical protein